jgi:hypothetical protein
LIEILPNLSKVILLNQSFIEIEVVMLKSVQSTEIAHFHYPANDVLPDEKSRISRLIDLNSAMAVTAVEHEEIGIIIQLRDGEEVEILSTLVDVEGDSVEVKGGHLIPITAILRVEI